MFANFSWIISYENTLALSHRGRFADPVLRGVLVHLLKKLVSFFGENVCLWPEVEVMFAMNVLHSVNSIGQKIFSCQFNAAGKVIDFLMLGHGLIEAIFERLGCPH